MNKEDIGHLAAGGCMVVCVALFILFTKLNELIEYRWLAVIVLLLINLLIVPQLVQTYYLYHGYQIGVVRFVPVYNYYLIFGKGSTIALTIGIVLVLVSLVGSFLPISFYVSFLEQHYAFWISNFLLHWSFVFLELVEVVIGIGFCSLLTEINKELYLKLSVRTRKSDVLLYASLLIPLVRIIPLKMIQNRIAALNQQKTAKRAHKSNLKKEVNYYE